VKKFFRKIKKKLSPLVLIPVVLLLALVLVGGYFLFFAGDDDSESTASTTPGASSKSDTGSDDETTTLKKPKGPKVPPDPPAGKEVTIDSDRDEKDYAVARAVGAVKTPERIAVRIGAAPKQPVTVNVNSVCTKASEATESNVATFSVTPPHTRDLKLPVTDAVLCRASANAQLTQAGEGRIKVFLIATRRGDV